MVLVGQHLSLMCIGQDVRGNIKLSLKATLQRTGYNADDVVGDLKASTQKEPNVFPPAGKVLIQQEKKDPLSEDQHLEHETKEAISSSASPVILIRSAAECDEEEKYSGVDLSSKNSSFTSTSSLNLKTEVPILNDMETHNEPNTSARKLKIGMELTAKVHQIRARGLVLDLGGGIRGMYRFEVSAILIDSWLCSNGSNCSYLIFNLVGLHMGLEFIFFSC